MARLFSDAECLAIVESASGRPFCGPSDLNGAAPVVTAPAVPGPGVRISPNASTWHQVAEFLNTQWLASLGLRMLP